MHQLYFVIRVSNFYDQLSQFLFALEEYHLIMKFLLNSVALRFFRLCFLISILYESQSIKQIRFRITCILIDYRGVCRYYCTGERIKLKKIIKMIMYLMYTYWIFKTSSNVIKFTPFGLRIPSNFF